MDGWSGYLQQKASFQRSLLLFPAASLLKTFFRLKSLLQLLIRAFSVSRQHNNHQNTFL